MTMLIAQSVSYWWLSIPQWQKSYLYIDEWWMAMNMYNINISMANKVLKWKYDNHVLISGSKAMSINSCRICHLIMDGSKNGLKCEMESCCVLPIWTVAKLNLTRYLPQSLSNRSDHLSKLRRGIHSRNIRIADVCTSGPSINIIRNRHVTGQEIKTLIKEQSTDREHMNWSRAQNTQGTIKDQRYQSTI